MNQSEVGDTNSVLWNLLLFNCSPQHVNMNIYFFEFFFICLEMHHPEFDRVLFRICMEYEDVLVGRLKQFVIAAFHWKTIHNIWNDQCSYFARMLKITIGFSLGDELGLTESLGNLEGNKRRSVSNFDAQLATANNNVGVLPADKLTVNRRREMSMQFENFKFERFFLHFRRKMKNAVQVIRFRLRSSRWKRRLRERPYFISETHRLPWRKRSLCHWVCQHSNRWRPASRCRPVLSRTYKRWSIRSKWKHRTVRSARKQLSISSTHRI